MKYLIILIVILGLTIPVHASSAVNIKSTLLHEAKHIQGDPRLNNVYFYTNIQIPYTSGKLVLSSTPDGMGPVRFFNSMHIYGTYPSGGYFEYAGNCADREIPPIIISKFMTIGQNVNYLNLSVGYRKERCGHATKIDGVYYDYADIGDLYLVHFDDSEFVPVPFLRLPWDYEAKGLSFQDAALRINSYFDHEYPLLSSGLQEGSEVNNNVISYAGLKIEDPYSSHDGYDWGSKAQAHLNDPVLAAADGVATYLYGAAQGNAILIDHGNGYQTRYYHLLSDGLVTSSSTNVIQGQQIGRLGSTGNSSGPHIHFMVVKDKNNDGNFEDNIPDGLVDPFGWRSFETDPWESYRFNYAGQDRTGSPSYYLWGEKNSFYTSSTLGAGGKKVLLSEYTLDFPQNAVLTDTILEVQLQPPEQSNNLYSVGNIIHATVEDGIKQQINTFNKLWNLFIKFNPIDIERFNPDTLSIYSRGEGEKVWLMEETIMDFVTGQALTSVDHMTEFALMGEKLDAVAPVTTVDISGTTNANGAYTSEVTLAITASDQPTEHSLGIAYTLYKLNEADWEEYLVPITVSNEGTHSIMYFSQDNDHNKEDAKTFTFTVDYSSLTPTPTSTLTPPFTVTQTPTPLSSSTPTPSPNLIALSTTPTPTPSPSSTPTATPSPTPIPPPATQTPTNTPTPKSIHRNDPPSLPSPTRTPIKKQPQILGAQDTKLQNKNHFLPFLEKFLGILISGSALGGGVWWKLRK